MTTWLLQHLIQAGHITETGATRRARIRTCGRPQHHLGPKTRCRDHVLLGLDNDRCAFEVTTDPTPLTPLGEALAILEHRRTFTLRREKGGWVLDPRDAEQITWAPAGTRTRMDVVRQHRCATPPATGPLAAPSSFPEVHPPIPAGATPPF